MLRGLSARGELHAPHGRLAVGILVFQDLSVIPMILLVPFLAGQGGSTEEVLSTLGVAVAVLLGVLAAGGVLIPRILSFVARTRERDLFVLAVLLVCLGTAWAVSLAGISLALGAFLAGLVVSGSEFRHQALSDLLATREVFASLFFVSVGMLLDVSEVFQQFPSTIGLLSAILVGKFSIILGTALILRLPFRVGILAAATLCQVGEFSFVLLDTASDVELLSASLSHNLLVAIILSMLLTPMTIAFGPHLASSMTRVPWLNELLGAQPPGFDADEPQSDHVIVAGYGMAGRAVCAALRPLGIPYLAVDLNADGVRLAREDGNMAVLGDVTQLEILEALGCENARLVVMSINDPNAAERSIRAIRGIAPDVPIIARAAFEMDRDALHGAGATAVVVAEAAAAAGIVGASLGALRPDTSDATSP